VLMNHCYKKGGHPAAAAAMRQYVHSIKIEILMLFVYYYSGMQQRPVKNRISPMNKKKMRALIV